MTDHTPTTEDWFDSLDADETTFTREALAAHDRKIAAEALREARDDLAAMVDDDLTVIVGDPDDDETWVPVRLEDWLDIRADRIEQGGES